MSPKKRDALVGNVADEQQLDEATQKLSLRDQQERDDIRKVMSTPEGRRECWRLLSMCGVYRTSVVPGAEQPFQVHFNEGQRNVGLWMRIRNGYDVD
jgi:hypothetical protein